jgi:ubiquinone/menaquinone biosynthesis C-methylase UbiE
MPTDPRSESQDGGTYRSEAAAEGWRRGAAARAQALGPLTELMLDLAGVGPGSRVLDVAAGTGEQTLLAARRAGPTGFVLATDIAASMLAAAAESAREAGLAHVETRVLDARGLDLEPDSFDAAICRLGLMFIPEREQALIGIRRVLKPGGRLAAVVFSSPARNAFVASPLAIARHYAGLPPAPFEDPGRFALADPAVLRALYAHAGFRDVVVQVTPVQRRFPSVAAAVQYPLDALPEVAKRLADLTDEGRAAARAEIEAVVRQFEGPEGVVAPGEYLIGVGAK